MKKNKRRLYTVLSMLLSLMLLSACEKKKTDDSGVELAAFTPPSDFVWEGSYIDRVDGLAVLTVEREGNGYHCYINVPDQAITHIESYEFNASPAEDGLGLAYTAGTRTSYTMPPENNPSQGVTTTDIYSDGTGRIYYLNGSVFWLDEKDDNGTGLIFERVEEESAVSENTVQ